MTEDEAKKFAEEWINSWNKHDLNSILEHYADELEYFSPVIRLLGFNCTGRITNKTDLEKYFRIGLNTYPDLHFHLHNYFAGINTVVLYYTSVNGKIVAEVSELTSNGKAVKVYCNYTQKKSAYLK
jgi:hypothetical protein